MRRVLALVLLLHFAALQAFAGVNRQLLKVSGDSAGTPPTEAIGFLTTTDPDHCTFSYRAGKNKESGAFEEGDFDLPYARITRFVYGETKHLRVGQTIALTALAGVGGLLLLLSKSHTHYLSIDYKDAADRDQVISFEVGKDAIRPIINSLEVRTGKKVELEATPTSQSPSKP